MGDDDFEKYQRYVEKSGVYANLLTTVCWFLIPTEPIPKRTEHEIQKYRATMRYYDILSSRLELKLIKNEGLSKAWTGHLYNPKLCSEVKE